jgi:hypothetical protein
VTPLNARACEKMLRPKQTMLSFFTKSSGAAVLPTAQPRPQQVGQIAALAQTA